MRRAEPEAPWPPRSPREALLSTPGGRQRYQRIADRTSSSPSPTRPPRILTVGDEPELDDEDDEETLQLKLQELQARLKLKKLQNARPRQSNFASALPPTAESQPAHGRKQGAHGSISTRAENERPGLAAPIQVPASPVKKRQQPEEQTSPRRVQLGIDKGLKAKDVSLKRAPGLKRTKVSQGSPQDGYLRRTRTPNPPEPSVPARPLSFNERLALVRSDESSQAERQKRIQKSRSKAFEIKGNEMEQYKKNAIDIPEEALDPPIFSRHEVLSKEWRGAEGLRRSNTAPSIHSLKMEKGQSSQSDEVQRTSQPEGEGSFDSYSTLHLSRRILPHTVLARHVSGKKIMTIKDVLREVKAPDFSLPDVEQDVVIFGIVAKKSEPRAHKPGVAKNGKKNEDRGKYMVMNICDLDFEVDLFLFNSGFERFWKLTEGTVVAILNPSIMPPPPGRQDTGRFSLVINSDGDTIIELGTSRDIGYCQSIKKEGNPCGAWVNKKRTNYCEYHTNEAVQKTRATRIELNTGGGFGYGPKRSVGSSSVSVNLEKKKPSNNFDWETKTRWFVSKSMSAADLLDGKDQTAEDKKERKAHLQRSLESKEREREIMKKLSKFGDAAGREYMKHSSSRNVDGTSISSSQAGDSEDREARHKAALKSLDLGGRSRSIHLSSIKRKRPDSSQAGSQLGSLAGRSSGLGWGSGLKDKLAKMKEGEKLRKEPDTHPPVRKKTRFVTDKGIREAGRDSLGNELSGRQVSLDDDDDDELVVVK